jgi:hypothetical protein
MGSAGGPWAEAACAASVRAQGEEAVPHRRTSFFPDSRLGVFNCVPRALFRNRVPFFLSVLPLFWNRVPLFRNRVPLFRNRVPLFRNRVPLFLSDVPLATEAAGRSVAAVLRAHAERATMRWPGGGRSSGGRFSSGFVRMFGSPRAASAPGLGPPRASSASGLGPPRSTSAPGLAAGCRPQMARLPSGWVPATKTS